MNSNQTWCGAVVFRGTCEKKDATDDVISTGVPHTGITACMNHDFISLFDSAAQYFSRSEDKSHGPGLPNAHDKCRGALRIVLRVGGMQGDLPQVQPAAQA